MISKVNKILDGIVEVEMLQSLGRQVLSHGRTATPVAMLESDGGSLVCLGKETSQGLVGMVDEILVDGSLTGSLEDDGRSWAAVVVGAPPESLFEGAKTGIVVVNELVKEAGFWSGGAIV